MSNNSNVCKAQEAGGGENFHYFLVGMLGLEKKILTHFQRNFCVKTPTILEDIYEI